MDIPQDLSSLKRRVLQALCKSFGIKANMKNIDMIEALEDVRKCETTSTCLDEGTPRSVLEKEGKEGMKAVTNDRLEPDKTQEDQITITTRGNDSPQPVDSVAVTKPVVQKSNQTAQEKTVNDSRNLDDTCSPQDRTEDNHVSTSSSNPHACSHTDEVSSSNIPSSSIEEVSSTSPRSHPDDKSDDLGSEAVTMMDMSIKVNVGSPLLSRDECLEMDQDVSSSANESLQEKEDANHTENEEEEVCFSGLDNQSQVVSQSITTNEPNSTGTDSVPNVSEDAMGQDHCEEEMEQHEETAVTTTTGLEEPASTVNSSQEYQTEEDVSDRLNKTFTIESPEEDIAIKEGTDPMAALNESLTSSCSGKKRDSIPLSGSWLMRDTAHKDSPLVNRTYVKKPSPVGDSMATSAPVLPKRDTPTAAVLDSQDIINKQEKEKENVASHRDEIMARLNSKVDTIMSDPNYVPMIKPSTTGSRIPLKKDSVKAKFDKLHAKEFNKMKSIVDEPTAVVSRKRKLEPTQKQEDVLHKNKKLKPDNSSAIKPPMRKQSTKRPSSKSVIDRLATPKHITQKKKKFTDSKTPGPFKL